MSDRVKSSRLRRAILAGVVALAAAITPIVSSPVPAQAAPVTGFNPSNIIDDSLFYNGNAMSAAEVQTFLNQKMTNCRIGTPSYMPGQLSPSGSGNIIASNCLRDFRMTTQSRPADSYCKAYTGAVNETAAQIIAKVAKACSISPKVLLVMLEKEQSLVSDSWPVTRQYNYAMGMNCPDSGPNNSANCNSDSAGFYLQMFLGARQLQVYKGDPSSFNYKPFQNNTIQWHPNSGCGTSQVYIENWATAALYIYTPYRPNQAALNAGWGTGDSCSSYGNRNFYNFYTSWFGSTQGGYTVSGDIGAYWNARGGANSIYGYPTAASTLRTTQFPKGAWIQTFSGGVISTEMNTRKTVGIPLGPVYDHINTKMNGFFGVLGTPIAEPKAYSVNGGGTLQLFQGGVVISAIREGTIASVPYDAVYDLYNGQLGGIYGAFGYPISNFSNYSGGKLQNFQNGFISQVTGSSSLVYMVKDEFYDYYDRVGGVYGPLGFPVSIAQFDANGTKTQEFQNGFLIQGKGRSVTEVSGKYLRAYRDAIATGSPLGLPTSEVRTTPINGGSEYQLFESGVIVTPVTTKTTVSVTGKLFEAYDQRYGGFGGAYGYPTGGPRVLTGQNPGILQLFQRGAMLLSNDGSAAVGLIDGTAIQKYYNTQAGGIYGWLGLPIADEVAGVDGSRSQQFQNGAVVVEANGNTVALPKKTAEHYTAAGGSIGVLGAQAAATRKYAVSDGLWLSFFKSGEILESIGDDTAATVLYSSPIYRYYNTQAGGIYGWLGLPIADEVAGVDGSRSQQFQNGAVVVEANGVTTAS